MPVTLKSAHVKYKDHNGQYVGINSVSDNTTAEQVAQITSTGTAQVNAVAAKGAQTLASIPQDYTTLSNDVGDLKSALTQETQTVYGQLTDGAFNITAFRQGSRQYNDPFDLRPSTSRCASSVFYVAKGDVISITGIQSGQKYALAIQSIYDSSWKTADFSYTSAYNGYAYVGVAASDGTSEINPTEIQLVINVKCNSLLSVVNSGRIDEINRYIQAGGWDSATGKAATNNNWYGLTHYIDDSVHSIINTDQTSALTLRFVLLAYDIDDVYVGAWNENTKTFVQSSPNTNMLLYTADIATVKNLHPEYKYKVTMVSANAMTLSQVLAAFTIIKEYDQTNALHDHNLVIENGFWAVANGVSNTLNYEWCRSAFAIPLNSIITYTPGTMLLMAYDSTGAYVGTWDKSTIAFSTTYNAANMSLDAVNMFTFAEWYPDYTFRLSFRKNSGISTLFLPVSYVKNNLHVSFDNNDADANLPGYYISYMSTKNQAIMDNINSVGKFGETFVFITDLHWESNYKKSPMLIDDIFKKTNVHILVCGGDIISRNTKAIVKESMMDCIKSFDYPTYLMHNTFGNHDSNAINWTDPADLAANSLSANDVFGMSQKNTSYANKYITETGINYYFDREDSKTRFIVLDTGIDSTYPIGTIPALCQTLNDTPNGYKIVIVQHWYFNGVTPEAASLTPTAQTLMGIVYQYNNRGSYSYGGATYSFSSASGEIVLMIGGHTHFDYVLSADDSNNTAGVPIVCVNCDSYRDNPTAIEGTTDEQCFDVVTVDYTNETIKCVRIGRGNNRTINY